jgi:hypothetical protein
MYISNLLAVGTATMLLLVGFSSSSLACAPQNILNPERVVGCEQSNTAEILSLEENLPSSDLIISSEKKVDKVANAGRFRTYKGRIIDTKDYIRARY